MAGGKKQVFVFLNEILFLARVEMVNLHRLQSSSPQKMLAGITATVLEVPADRVQPDLSVITSCQPLLRCWPANDAGLYGIRHIA